MDINKIINIVRDLKEDGMAVGAPTNSMAGGNIAGSVEAGDDPPVRKKKDQRKVVIGRFARSLRKDGKS